ncbi:MAG: hypothetical protein O3C20_21560 [Verrucomicrobia bacterium]|nr:hypothetical protein [Verrucomicrobiota bacterium]
MKLFSSAVVLELDGSDYLEASYLRQEDLPLGVIIKAQFSNDLSDWSTEFVIEGDTPSNDIVATLGDPDDGMRRIAVLHGTAVDYQSSYRFIRFHTEQR